jgi:ABC-type bacteriocin/lantibiotic exporter with double-glycine peptidase domain
LLVVAATVVVEQRLSVAQLLAIRLLAVQLLSAATNKMSGLPLLGMVSSPLG